MGLAYIAVEAMSQNPEGPGSVPTTNSSFLLGIFPLESQIPP